MKIELSKLLNTDEKNWAIYWLNNNKYIVMDKFPKGGLLTKIDKKLVIIDNCNGNNRLYI